MSRAAPPPKPLRLVMTTNSLRNTTFSVDTDKFYYEIVTRFWDPNVTRIQRLDTEKRELTLVAEIENLQSENKAEPRVRLEGKEWESASKFLREHEQKQGKIGGLVEGPKGETLRWKSHKRTMQLVKAESNQPVVQHHHHSRHFWVFRMSKHAWLEVQPEVEDSLDMIIITFLLAERRRRDAKPSVRVTMS